MNAPKRFAARIAALSTALAFTLIAACSQEAPEAAVAKADTADTNVALEAPIANAMPDANQPKYLSLWVLNRA